MKAWICKELIGEQGMEAEEVQSPEVFDGQILVRNHCTALNFPDTLVTRGLYQMKLAPPFVPGSELAGEVIAVGQGVEGVSAGQRVLAMTGFGAFAEEVLVSPPMQQIHAIPDAMSFAEAASFNMTYGTAIHGLKQRGRLQVGETLLVLGAAGGCGSAAVQVGKAMGARVIAGASSSLKCEAALASGADDVVNYKREDLRDTVMSLTNGKGADLVFDPVGDSLFDQAVRCVGWNGRYLVVGFAGGEIPKIGINYTIIKSISIVGVAYGMSAINAPSMNEDNFSQLFSWYKAGSVKPAIGKSYAFKDMKIAMNEMHIGETMGKTVVLMS